MREKEEVMSDVKKLTRYPARWTEQYETRLEELEAKVKELETSNKRLRAQVQRLTKVNREE